MTQVINITYEQVYTRLSSQLPPWFGNQSYVAPPVIPGEFTATTNFNNILWAYLITAYSSYYQFQYDWVQMRIGAYEIANDPNWPVTFPANYPIRQILPSVVNITIRDAGKNYVVDDTITLSGGESFIPAVLLVTGVNSGAITTFTVLDTGTYATTPANPVSQGSTSGVGSAATFTVTFQPNPPQFPIAYSDNLDLIAQDFFGSYLTRGADESDDNFRNRILVNVMSLKASRPAMQAALTNLVAPAFEQAGFTPFSAYNGTNGKPDYQPLIIENESPADTGAYNTIDPVRGPTLAFNSLGGYGSGSYPYTCTIYVFLPNANGLGTFPGFNTPGESPNAVAGEGFGLSAYTPMPPLWYGSDSLLNYYVTAADVQNVIFLTKVLGTICYLFIEYVPQFAPPELFDWVDSSGNNIVDNLGNQIIFNVVI